MRIDAIPIGKNPPDDINVIVEVPHGGHPVKYEMDKESGTLFVDRFMHTAMQYPAITASCRTRCRKTATPSTCWWWSHSGGAGRRHPFAPHRRADDA